MAISIRSVTYNEDVWPQTSVAVTTSETPSATQVGDLVVVIHAIDWDTLASMQTPTATGSPTLTPITNGSVDAGTDLAHIKSYTYVANTGGAQTITATQTGDAFSEKAVIAYVLAGADTTTPIDVAGGSFSATNVATWVLASISPSTSDAFLIAHANRGGSSSVDASLTLPGGMTSQYNDIVGLSMGGATEQLSASGATGTRTFNPETGDRPFAGVLIAIKTASAAAPTYAMLRPAVVAP